MDRLLTVDDLRPVDRGGLYDNLGDCDCPHLPGTGDEVVKFRIRDFRGHFKVGIAVCTTILHGTPEENAKNIATSAGAPCQWVLRDWSGSDEVWSTCEPGD